MPTIRTSYFFKTNLFIVFGLLLLAFYIFLGIYTTRIEAYTKYRYNFITRSAFKVCTYGSLLFSCYIILYILSKSKEIGKVLRELERIKRELKKFIPTAPVAIKSKPTAPVQSHTWQYSTYFGLLVISILLDILLLKNKDVVALIFLYMPAITINMSISWVVNITSDCCKLFYIIGNILTDLNRGLGKRYHQDGVLTINQVLPIHNNVRQVTRHISNLIGLPMCFFSILTGLSCCLCIYTLTIDLMRWDLGYNLVSKVVNAPEFMAITYLTTFVKLLITANELKYKFKELGPILQLLREKAVTTPKEIDLYPCQYLRDFEFDAAGFFILDSTAMFGFFGNLIIWIFICLQFDKGY